MAAPSTTQWGNTVTGAKSTRKGKIGIYTGVTETTTQVTVNVQVWFWSMYSVDDSNNSYYYNANATTATTLIGAKNINHTVATGSGWSTSNQTKLGESTYTYNKGHSAATKSYAAKFTGLDTFYASSVMSKTVSITVPKLASYTVTYNANGGSGAPSNQTKWYGETLKLQTGKPTRSGYTFKGWATSSSGSVAYASGANYTTNAAITLYAVWAIDGYTVSYNANGGTGAPSSQFKQHGVTLTLSTTIPTRSGYEFKGWATSATGGVAYASGSKYTSNANITLYAVWIKEDTRPSFVGGFSVNRCNSSGQLDDSGKNALVTFGWSCPESIGVIMIQWLSNGSVVGSTSLTQSGTSGYVSTKVGNNGLDVDITYIIRVTVFDATGVSCSTSGTLYGTKFMIDCLAGGNGIAFGKSAQMPGYAEFGFNIVPSYGTSYYMTMADGSIKKLIHNDETGRQSTIIGYDNYNNKDLDTELCGRSVWICPSTSTGAYDRFTPYCGAGQELSFTIRTSGYVTNAGKNIVFLVPYAAPIIGASRAIVESLDGFVLRQGNSYTHGSAASTYVHPDSYSAIVSKYCGVYITAVFSDTTNVTNNDAIGIYWDGTITLMA